MKWEWWHASRLLAHFFKANQPRQTEKREKKKVDSNFHFLPDENGKVKKS
jgi:hypothetical protein